VLHREVWECQSAQTDGLPLPLPGESGASHECHSGQAWQATCGLSGHQMIDHATLRRTPLRPIRVSVEGLRLAYVSRSRLWLCVVSTKQGGRVTVFEEAVSPFNLSIGPTNADLGAVQIAPAAPDHARRLSRRLSGKADELWGTATFGVTASLEGVAERGEHGTARVADVAYLPSGESVFERSSAGTPCFE
jgi:hypothetical protein